MGLFLQLKRENPTGSFPALESTVFKTMSMKAIRNSSVELRDPELVRRRAENRHYLMELDSGRLLLHHRFEAGFDFGQKELSSLHGGWENPLCQLRGHFLGHWLSAAAMQVAVTQDAELKAKADAIVQELAKCQTANGGEWCASIPEKYLDRIARGEAVWAPQYTIHKTFMGLMDMYEYTGNCQALDIAIHFAAWFHRWSKRFSDTEFARILDVETGGMLEVWSQLYGITKDPVHRELMDRYYRHNLFDGLLAGGDVLTNMHANTTIPEALGAARAYEVTGEEKWFGIVRAYWDQAVTQRGHFCTGGQTCGEVWTPKHRFAARLGEKNQEHCTVYNMMRLADFLFRHTGDAQYADYWERNLYNGIMAQGYYQYDRGGQGVHSLYPESGLLTYFLPLKSGAIKAWASRTNDFFCCHGTLVQANASHVNGIYYQDDNGLYVCQYFPSDAAFEIAGKKITVQQRADALNGNSQLTSSVNSSQTIKDQDAMYNNSPDLMRSHLYIACETEASFSVRVRVPWWHRGDVNVYLNGVKQQVTLQNGFFTVQNHWCNDDLCFEFKKTLSMSPLPDQPDTVAFLYGPIVLAGICGGQALRVRDTLHPEEILRHDNEREWGTWRSAFRTTGQDKDIAFVPLYQVGYEAYSVYFPIKEARD